MASDGQLREWVSDRLMTLLGYSKSVVVQYVIRLAKECSSTGHLVRKLVEFGFAPSEETQTFAADIYAKVPRRAIAISNYQKQEREAAKLLQKQSTYQLLADDDDNDADNQTSTTRQSSANQASKSRKHFRRKAEDQDGGDDDNEKITKDSGRNVRRKIEEDNEEDGDNSSDDEQERIKDQQERAQLEKNMRERDAANTRKLMERQLSKEEQEELNRRSQAMDKNDTSDLRKYSRQAYLQKRRDKKIEEIRDEILDHEYIFHDVKLTEAEEEELRYKQRIYALVKDHVESADDIGEYKMPEAYDMGENVNQEKRFSVAMQRYKDPEGKDKMNPFAEQEAWEEHQIGKSKLQFGSKDRKRSSDDYQYVFEDGIDFVKSSVIEGTQDEDYSDQEDIDAKDMLKKELQDERKTLPIYKFRDELLKAVEEYQVIVIVGETGSGKTTQIPQYLHEAGYTAKGKVRSMKRARDIRDQLEGLLERVEIEVCSNASDLDAIKKAITSGFFHHSTRLQMDGTYKTVKNPQIVHIHPSSGLAEVRPRWVIYHELVLTTKEFMRQVTELKPEWLVEIAPHYYQLKDVDDSGTKKLPKGQGRASL